ncbi:MAG: ParB family transcriptional regulator, chromosome partitioning protein [Pyrinomonadaceae bacterium]|nr:ParB family transcriptional regulator, chromosome partitioning protein [Pyrinomonadaceae bacterium]
MTRKVLGRGLSALLSETPATSSEELREVDIDLIEPNNVQPRTRFDEAQLEELAQSIKTNGVVQPILVRKTNGGRYQIVAGERRWRAAQRAGLQRIPSVIRDVPDDKMLELALIENIQRQELNAIEEAYAYKRLIETFNLTQETVAQRVGRDRTFVTNYLRLLRLPEDIQLLVEESKLSMGHARALLGIDDADKQREIARGIIERSLSVRDTERAVKRVAAGGESNPTAVTTSSDRSGDANTRAAESKLRRRLGTQVHIIPNPSGEGGKIEVQYYNEADLQRVYELVMGAQNALGDM